MRVNIRDVKTYYINTEANLSRRSSIEEVANQIGINNLTRFEGIVDESPKGCAKSHSAVLSNAARAKLPVLILEDDALVNPHYQGDFEVEVPDDADALYLGLTRYGVRDHITNKGFTLLVAEEATEGVYRVQNMLAAHAVMFFNKDYMRQVRELASAAAEEGINQDLKRARDMKNWKVYALDTPMFIQGGLNKYSTQLDLSSYLFKTNLNNPNIDL